MGVGERGLVKGAWMRGLHGVGRVLMCLSSRDNFLSINLPNSQGSSLPFFLKARAYSVQGSTSGSGPSGVMAFGFISP